VSADPLCSIMVDSATAMRSLGTRLAGDLRGGDLLLLSGPVGAGKTTLVQGIATGLGVHGAVTSPTFVIARVHRALAAGPDLVHVDAYRLSGFPEIDDLDLDSAVDTSVTVVEWGEGKAERLVDERLEVNIHRDLVGDTADGPRTVTIRGVGPRWLR
jgi:tRNA threonylcarbamoyladenosine biosynthesis protein TsaE